jgi:hypothetical protein
MSVSGAAPAMRVKGRRGGGGDARIGEKQALERG